MLKGLYIHIPFCSYKCPYCDFVSFADPSADRKEYLNLLLKEITLYKGLDFDLRTIYFGGRNALLDRSRALPRLYGGAF